MTSALRSTPSLTLVRQIKAPPQAVFAAFVEPARILKWWGPDAGPTLLAETEVRVGGRFRVVFETLDGERHENSGEYLEIDPPARLVMAWWWASTPDRRSRVTVSIRPISNGSELTVHHEMLFDEAAREMGSCCSSQARSYYGRPNVPRRFCLPALKHVRGLTPGCSPH
jgi:uncharacterized protein YndB with AHSA1/START domain